MKAVLMTATGGPEVLQFTDVPDPGEPGPAHIRVRLKAAGVNPVDTKLRAKGTYFPERLPTILGCDGAGIVDATGSAVTRFRKGDEVYFCNGGIGGDCGNYAEYALIHEEHAARKPVHWSFEEAAAAPLVLITAWESLHDRAQVKPGSAVLVHAGAGGVGHAAIQLVKAAGARVITTVGSGDKAAFARGLGADATILYRDTDFVQSVLDWTAGEGVDLALDTVGGSTFQRTFAAVRPYGEVVTLLQPGADMDWKVPRLRNQRMALELMLSPMYFGWPKARRHQATILERCAELATKGVLKMSISHVLPLSEAAEAHRIIEAGGVTGKIVLRVE